MRLFGAVEPPRRPSSNPYVHPSAPALHLTDPFAVETPSKGTHETTSQHRSNIPRQEGATGRAVRHLCNGHDGPQTARVTGGGEHALGR